MCDNAAVALTDGNSTIAPALKRSTAVASADNGGIVVDAVAVGGDVPLADADSSGSVAPLIAVGAETTLPATVRAGRDNADTGRLSPTAIGYCAIAARAIIVDYASCFWHWAVDSINKLCIAEVFENTVN
jgi:hypothetical protein